MHRFQGKELPRRTGLIGLLAVLWLVACSKPPPLPAIPAGQTVLAFGDSVTFGTGAGTGEDWPTLLATATGWAVVNAGVPGDTAAAGKSRLAALLSQHRPALVIIELGGNDFLQRRSAAAIKADLRQIIQEAQQSGAHVAVVAVPELSLMSVLFRHPSDAPLYAELGGIRRNPRKFRHPTLRPATIASKSMGGPSPRKV